MRAAVLTELKKPLELIDDIVVPELQPGQVLVKIAYSGVCHSQVMEAFGRRGEDPWLPHMLGHEATGRVIEAGPKVSKIAVGDLVVLSWIKGQGMECGGCSYVAGDRVINAGGVATFCDQAVVSENRVTRLPKDVPLDIGVLLGCAVPTGAGLVLNELQPRAGSTVAVFGLGGIGLCALMAARTLDLGKLIAVDISDEKLQLAAKLGADLVIDAKRVNPVDAVREASPPGADYCVECSGLVSVIEQAFAASHPKRGVTIFASHPKVGDRISLDPHHLISGRQIRGSWGGASEPDRDIPKYADLFLTRRMPLEHLVSQYYRLDEVNEALADLAAGKVFRPIIEINRHV